MKQIYRLSILLCLMISVMPSFAQKKKGGGNTRNEYVVLASKDVQNDAAWMQVVDALKNKHKAEVFFTRKLPVRIWPIFNGCVPVTWLSWRNRRTWDVIT